MLISLLMIWLYNHLDTAFHKNAILHLILFIPVMISFTFVNFNNVSALSNSPLVITGKIDPNVTTISNNIVATVNLTNIGNLPLNGIDVQVISSDLKILSEKKWPDKIYPNSSISGQYILQASNTGSFPITISSTYLVNNTATKPPEIRQGVSSAKLGDAIVQPDLGLSWSSVWNSTITTLIGAFFGFLISKA